jgi:membrane protein YdbS with pleckstrin-like domain
VNWLAKLVRGFGWLLLVVSLIFFVSMIAMFFTVDSPERWSAAPVAIVFALLAFLGWKIKKYKKGKSIAKNAPSIQNHWEVKDKDDGIEVKHYAEASITNESQVKQYVVTPDNELDIADQALASLQQRRQPRERKITYQKSSIKPLLELCAEIENDTENNYTPFDPPIPVEIVYRDNDGETTRREIDVLYIAKSNYDDSYYIKAFCHLRDEERTFKVERIRQTIVDENTVDFVQYLVDTYRNTDKYKETVQYIKTWNLLNSTGAFGCAAKILTYIARIDGIFTRKEKITIASFLKEVDIEQGDMEIDDYVKGLADLEVSTAQYKNIVKSAGISESLVEKAREITGKDPLRQGALEILLKQHGKDH